MRRRPLVLSLVASLLLVGGAAVLLRSLWTTWAVDGPRLGRNEPQSGWEWMAFGDVLLTLVAVLAVVVAVTVPLRRARRGAVLAAACTLAILAVLAMGGVGIVYELTELGAFFELPEYQAGRGPQLAGWALVTTVAGALVAVIASTRAVAEP
jgi:hypothetical protein